MKKIENEMIKKMTMGIVTNNYISIYHRPITVVFQFDFIGWLYKRIIKKLFNPFAGLGLINRFCIIPMSLYSARKKSPHKVICELKTNEWTQNMYLDLNERQF